MQHLCPYHLGQFYPHLLEQREELLKTSAEQTNTKFNNNDNNGFYFTETTNHGFYFPSDGPNKVNPTHLIGTQSNIIIESSQNKRFINWSHPVVPEFDFDYHHKHQQTDNRKTNQQSQQTQKEQNQKHLNLQNFQNRPQKDENHQTPHLNPLTTLPHFPSDPLSNVILQRTSSIDDINVVVMTSPSTIVQTLMIHNQQILHSRTFAPIPMYYYRQEWWEQQEQQRFMQVDKLNVPFLFTPHRCETASCIPNDINTSNNNIPSYPSSSSSTSSTLSDPTAPFPTGVLSLDEFRQQVRELISFKIKQHQLYQQRLATGTLGSLSGISVGEVLSGANTTSSTPLSLLLSSSSSSVASQSNPSVIDKSSIITTADSEANKRQSLSDKRFPKESKNDTKDFNNNDTKSIETPISLTPPVICPHLLPIDLNFQQSNLCLCRKADCPFCFGWAIGPSSQQYNSENIKTIKSNHQNGLLNAFRPRAIPRSAHIAQYPSCLPCYNIVLPRLRYPIFSMYYTHLINCYYRPILGLIYRKLNKMIYTDPVTAPPAEIHISNDSNAMDDDIDIGSMMDDMIGLVSEVPLVSQQIMMDQREDEKSKKSDKNDFLPKGNRFSILQQLQMENKNYIKSLDDQYLDIDPMLQFYSQWEEMKGRYNDLNHLKDDSQQSQQSSSSSSQQQSPRDQTKSPRPFSIDQCAHLITKILSESSRFISRVQRSQHLQTLPLSSMFSTPINIEPFIARNLEKEYKMGREHLEGCGNLTMDNFQCFDDDNPNHHSNNDNDFLVENSPHHTSHLSTNNLNTPSLSLPTPTSHPHHLDPLLTTQRKIYQQLQHLRSLLPNMNTIANTSSPNSQQFYPLQDVLLTPLASNEITQSLALPMFVLINEPKSLSMLPQQSNPIYTNLVNGVRQHQSRSTTTKGVGNKFLQPDQVINQINPLFSHFQRQQHKSPPNQQNHENQSSQHPITPSSLSHHPSENLVRIREDVAFSNNVKQLSFPSLSSSLLSLMTTPRARSRILESSHRYAQMAAYMKANPATIRALGGEEDNSAIINNRNNNMNDGHDNMQNNNHKNKNINKSIPPPPPPLPQLFKAIPLPDHYLLPMLLLTIPSEHPAKLHYSQYLSTQTRLFTSLINHIKKEINNTNHIGSLLNTSTSATPSNYMTTTGQSSNTSSRSKLMQLANYFVDSFEKSFRYTYPPQTTITFPSPSHSYTTSNTMQHSDNKVNSLSNIASLSFNQSKPNLISNSNYPPLGAALNSVLETPPGAFVHTGIHIQSQRLIFGSLLDYELLDTFFKKKLSTHFTVAQLTALRLRHNNEYNKNQKEISMGITVKPYQMTLLDYYLSNPAICSFFSYMTPLQRQFNPMLLLSNSYLSLYTETLRNVPSIPASVANVFPLFSPHTLLTFCYLKFLQQQFTSTEQEYHRNGGEVSSIPPPPPPIPVEIQKPAGKSVRRSIMIDSDDGEAESQETVSKSSVNITNIFPSIAQPKISTQSSSLSIQSTLSTSNKTILASSSNINNNNDTHNTNQFGTRTTAGGEIRPRREIITQSTPQPPQPIHNNVNNNGFIPPGFQQVLDQRNKQKVAQIQLKAIATTTMTAKPASISSPTRPAGMSIDSIPRVKNNSAMMGSNQRNFTTSGGQVISHNEVLQKKIAKLQLEELERECGVLPKSSSTSTTVSSSSRKLTPHELERQQKLEKLEKLQKLQKLQNDEQEQKRLKQQNQHNQQNQSNNTLNTNNPTNKPIGKIHAAIRPVLAISTSNPHRPLSIPNPQLTRQEEPTIQRNLIQRPLIRPPINKIDRSTPKPIAAPPPRPVREISVATTTQVSSTQPLHSSQQSSANSTNTHQTRDSGTRGINDRSK